MRTITTRKRNYELILNLISKGKKIVFSWWYMKTDLAIKQIYDDFKLKVILTDNEKDILDRYIKGDTYVNIAMKIAQSYSNVSRAITELKKKYEIYKKLELSKLNLLTDKK